MAQKNGKGVLILVDACGMVWVTIISNSTLAQRLEVRESRI